MWCLNGNVRIKLLFRSDSPSLKDETPPARTIMDRVDVREMTRRVPVIPFVRAG